MSRRLLALGALSALFAVALGAFAAHALKARLEAPMLAIFETGARYQMYHALALLAVGLLAERRPSRLLAASGGFFFIGTLLFSGSLYALALTGVRGLGSITPFGGVAFIAGWLCFAVAAVKR